MQGEAVAAAWRTRRWYARLAPARSRGASGRTGGLDSLSAHVVRTERGKTHTKPRRWDVLDGAQGRQNARNPPIWSSSMHTTRMVGDAELGSVPGTIWCTLRAEPDCCGLGRNHEGPQIRGDDGQRMADPPSRTQVGEFRCARPRVYGTRRTHESPNGSTRAITAA